MIEGCPHRPHFSPRRPHTPTSARTSEGLALIREAPVMTNRLRAPKAMNVTSVA